MRGPRTPHSNLLSGIEGRAGECTWLDGSNLSAEQRVLLARLTPLHPIAFHPDVREYARCLVATPRGVAEVTTLRFVGDRARATFAPRDAQWRAEQLTWSVPADDLDVGADVRSAMALSMAARTPPFEVVATSPPNTTLTIRTTWMQTERGVVIETDYRGAIPDVPDEDMPVAVGMLLMIAEGAHDVFGPRTRRQAFGQPMTFSWTMLALEANDADLAQRTRVQSRTLISLSEIDPARIDLIRAAALQHCAEARRAEGAHRIAHSRACASFYAHLYAREERVADAVLAVTSYREAGALMQARALAERAFRDAPDDSRARAMWLEVAGRETLAAAFAEMHPEVLPRDRQRFVDAAPSYLAEGLSGQTLEASFLASLTSSRTPNVRLASAVALPSDALADLAYVLLLAEGAEGPLTVRVEGALRSDAPMLSLGVGARWTLAQGPVWAAQLAEPTFQAVRTISQAVQTQLAAGGLVRFTAMMGAHQLTWSLMLETGRVQLQADTARRDWPSLARDVAFPLAQLPATRFPAPTLSLTLPSETLDALQPTLVSIAGVQCVIAAQTLACSLREQGPEALLQVLVELARIHRD